jgi:hypothetical protein
VLVASEPELRRLVDVFTSNGVPHAAVVEDVAPYANALMAIGVAPVTPGVQRWLRHLPMLREVKPPPS